MFVTTITCILNCARIAGFKRTRRKHFSSIKVIYTGSLLVSTKREIDQLILTLFILLKIWKDIGVGFTGVCVCLKYGFNGLMWSLLKGAASPIFISSFQSH